MFNDRYGLTEAVLSGRKTQTRRIIPQSVIHKASEYQLQYFDATLDAISEREAIEQIYFVERLAKLPYQVGEVVAVAQSYKGTGVAEVPSPIENIFFEAHHLKGWNNKMFVRADLMPHQIRITNVRVERLQDISDEDCIKEGIEFWNDFLGKRHYCLFDKQNKGLFPHSFTTARQAYAALIDRISGKGTWESNPFVFVYDFELIK